MSKEREKQAASFQPDFTTPLSIVNKQIRALNLKLLQGDSVQVQLSLLALQREALLTLSSAEISREIVKRNRQFFTASEEEKEGLQQELKTLAELQQRKAKPRKVPQLKTIEKELEQSTLKPKSSETTLTIQGKNYPNIVPFRKGLEKPGAIVYFTSLHGEYDPQEKPILIHGKVFKEMQDFFIDTSY
jgi:hypothetical protein